MSNVGLQAIPEKYKWVLEIGKLPKSLFYALSFCGLIEKKGSESNPIILDWAKTLSVSDYYNSDSIAWCGLGKAIATKMAGYNPPKNFLAAKNWINYGTYVSPSASVLGDTVIYSRPGGHHVAWQIALTKDKKSRLIYGANQSDSFCFEFKSNENLIGVRRDPFKIGMPVSCKRYFVDFNGILATNDQ